MSKNSIVVFDIDGTLTDSISQHQKAFERALRRFPFPALRTEWSSYRHHSDSGIFVEAWEDAGWSQTPDLAALESHFQEEFDAVLEVDPIDQQIAGAATFLELLPKTKWAPVFATGSLRHGALRKLAALHTSFHQNLLVTASEYQAREEIVSNAILQAKKRYDIASIERIVSIGDGIWDLKTARNLGIEFVGIGSGKKAEQLTSFGATVYTDYEQGLEILD